MGDLVQVNSKKSRNVVTFESIKIPEALKEFVSVQNGVPVCTSVQVAEKLKMEHFQLRKTIQDLILEEELTCSGKVNNLFFEGISFDCCRSEYVDSRNRKQESFTLTKTAFLLVSMAAKSPEARKWRRRYVDAFDKLAKLVLDEANRKIMQLTKPQEAVWIPVFNEFDKKIYKVLAPMDNYTDAQRLVIRKASAIVHARSTISNAKKWEKEYLGGDAMSYMPSVWCEVDKDGNFLDVPKASELRIARLPKLSPDAFKRTQWAITAIKKK